MPKTSLTIAITSLLTGAAVAAILWQSAPAATATPQMLAEAAWQAMGGEKLGAIKAFSVEASCSSGIQANRKLLPIR